MGDLSDGNGTATDDEIKFVTKKTARPALSYILGIDSGKKITELQREIQTETGAIFEK